MSTFRPPRSLSLLVGAILCITAGTMLGSRLPPASAQTAAPVPDAPAPATTHPRWEQFCELKGGIGTGDRRLTAVDGINRTLAARGADGWMLAQTPVVVGNHGPNIITGDLLLCYTRPAR